jgi:hypothetical protein
MQNSVSPIYSPAVIDTGLPVQSQVEGGVVAQIGRSTAPFVPLGQGRSGHREFSLSQALEEADWDNLLPPCAVLEKYVSKKLANPTWFHNAVINLNNGLASVLFFMAAVAFFNRFLWFVIVPELRNDDHHWSESGRAITNAGAFLASFMITLGAAVMNQAILFKTRRTAAQTRQTIMDDYSRIREHLVHEHHLTWAFFAIVEVIFELRSLSPRESHYLSQYGALEARLGIIFAKINHPFDLCTGVGVRSITALPPDTVILRLKTILAGEKFSSIIDELIKYVRHSTVRLVHDSLLRPGALGVRSDYCEHLDNDPRTQGISYTLSIFIDIIAEVSSKKVRVGRSVLLEPVELIERSTLSGIKVALIEYWNGTEIKTPLVHPYDVSLPEIALLINSAVRARLPGLMLRGHALPVMLPVYLPAEGLGDEAQAESAVAVMHCLPPPPHPPPPLLFRSRPGGLGSCPMPPPAMCGNGQGRLDIHPPFPLPPLLFSPRATALGQGHAPVLVVPPRGCEQTGIEYAPR